MHGAALSRIVESNSLMRSDPSRNGGTDISIPRVASRQYHLSRKFENVAFRITRVILGAAPSLRANYLSPLYCDPLITGHLYLVSAIERKSAHSMDGTSPLG